MTAAAILDVSRDGLATFLKVAGPLMLIALVVALLLFLPFMADALGSYMIRIAARIAAGG